MGRVDEGSERGEGGDKGMEKRYEGDEELLGGDGQGRKRRWTREKTEVVKERKRKVWGEKEHVKEEKKSQRGGQETKKELIRDHAEREEEMMEGKEEVRDRWIGGRRRRKAERKRKTRAERRGG